MLKNLGTQFRPLSPIACPCPEQHPTAPAPHFVPQVKHLKDEIAKLKKAIDEGGGSEELTDELKERHRLVGDFSKCARESRRSAGPRRTDNTVPGPAGRSEAGAMRNLVVAMYVPGGPKCLTQFI